MNQSVPDSSKPTYRVITLTHFGAKASYVCNSSMDKNALEYLFGNAYINGLKSLARISEARAEPSFLNPFDVFVRL